MNAVTFGSTLLISAQSSQLEELAATSRWQNRFANALDIVRATAASPVRLPVPRDDKKGIDWIVSSEWPREEDEDTPERGIILFDEITAADSTLQVAAYEFILDRRLGQLYQVPDGWYIVAAGNRTGDAAVARTMSSD